MKKNVTKKLLAGALASTMVLSMAACGETEQTGSSTPADSGSVASPSTSTPASTPAATPEPTPEPPISISIALPADETHQEENEWYDKLVATYNEYTNADITWIWQDSTSYYDQLTLRYISGDLPDVLVVGDDTMFTTAAQAGLFWDLTPYIDQFDNFATIPQAVRENASTDGKLYAIPRSRDLGRNGWGYRVDWLNNLGLAEPTTWEAFKEMCYAFTYNDPDGNGVDDTVGLFLDSWTGAFDSILTWLGVPNVWGLDENGDLIHRSQTKQYKAALAELREMYSLGTINNGTNGIPDFMEVGPGKARNEGLRTQMGGVMVQVLDECRKVQTYFQDQGITTEDEVIFTLAGGLDGGYGYLTYPTKGYSGKIAISTKNIKTEEQLLKVLDVLNDLSDGEAMSYTEFGFKDLTYRIDENGYVVRFTTEELAASGVGSTSYLNGFNQIISYWIAEENARPADVAPSTTPISLLEAKLKSENCKYVVPNYGASYASDTYDKSNGALDAILTESMLAYIRGEIDENGLDEQLKTWWTAGGEQVTKEMNEKYHASKK